LTYGIGKARDLLDQVAPFFECLVALACVRPDRNWPPDMIENNRRLRESARQVDQIVELRLEHPGVEG
jgi:hypothetical protein